MAKRTETTRSVWIAKLTDDEGRLVSLLSYEERREALVKAGRQKAQQLSATTTMEEAHVSTAGQ